MAERTYPAFPYGLCIAFLAAIEPDIDIETVLCYFMTVYRNKISYFMFR